MAEKIYVGIGSNIGDRESNIKEALELLLKDAAAVSSLEVAPLYSTEPVGYADQDWFLNTVASFETALDPQQLLGVLMGIENKMGRVRTIRWGPRVIDLDILLYGDSYINCPDLQIPHPRMEERAFVVVPLADLSPDLLLPGGQKAARVAEYLSKSQHIERFSGKV
ncbi:MAG: 2-amino-4-hydroxy-6-hydroxymethyldihydropteridine diphosphokinase [Desulfocucumaceae bacterium]